MIALLGSALACACEGAPAHSKPWRRPLRSESAPAATGDSAAAQAHQKLEAARRNAQTLHIRLESEPSHLNPLVDPDVDTLRVAEDTIFEGLLALEPSSTSDAKGALVPRLATSWRVLAGGSELRIVLRPGVKFHDGDDLSAVDAQFSIDLARSAEVRAPRLREGLADVVAVELAGPLELRVVLRKPNAFILRALAEVPILPAHVYGGPQGARSSAIEKHPKNRAPVGTGPFRLARWDHGERIVLERNNAYWGPAPLLEEVEFVIEPDAAKALTRAKRGEIDVIPALAPIHYPDQANAMAADFRILRLRPARLRYLLPNVRKPPLDDARVRQAMSRLIDRLKLTTELEQDMARPVAGPIWPGGPGDGAGSSAPGIEPTQAAERLEAAGWLDTDGDGVRERSGQTLRLSLLATPDPKSEAEREVIVAALRKGGFVVDLRVGDPNVLRNRLKSGDFELALLDWRARRDEDLTPLLGSQGERNWGGFSSKAMDAALAAVGMTWDPAARAPLYAEVARIFAETLPIIPLYAPDPIGLVHKRVQGMIVSDGWFSLRQLSLKTP